MKTIINFLSQQLDSSFLDEDVQISTIDFERLNKSFADLGLREHQAFKILPRVKQYQIWLVKSVYFDYLGIERTTDHPFIVILESNPETINDEEFVRVNPISPFVEMYSQQEVICDDPEVIGFPFMIELWNSQPILVELLDKYLGYFEYQNIPKENVSISPDLLEFRKIEISRASFLNNSIRSLLGFFESTNENDRRVFVTFDGKRLIPKPENYIVNSEKSFLRAAKSGKKSELIIKNFEISELDFGVIITSTIEGYVVSVESKIAHKLLNSANEPLVPLFHIDRVVYSEIQKAIYYLYLEGINTPIVIRLK